MQVMLTTVFHEDGGGGGGGGNRINPENQKERPKLC